MNIPVRKYDDFKCIWMSSDLINYRLCSNSFDCETCNFYKNIYDFKSNQNNYQEQNTEFYKDKIKSTIKRLELCRKLNTHPYYFLKNNIILKNFSGDKYYLGLNPAIYVLLDNVTYTGFNSLTNLIEKNEPFFRVDGDWGNIEIQSPIKFFLLWDMKLSSKEFFNSKWIGFVETDIKTFENNLLTEEEFNQNISHINNQLTELLSSYKNVGETMMDGGMKVRYLHQIFGKEKYLSLLNHLLKI